ncbi:hypothetical protein R1flu_027109 [Riccia fluitans]|uniref:Uncharacterized protein n=1 Tax=Riccia fluitans TaxID=41844 RepID=A0ABD1XKT7_9MARC
MQKLGNIFLGFVLFYLLALQVSEAVDFKFYRRLNCVGDVVGTYTDVAKDTCAPCDTRAVSVKVTNATDCQKSYAYVTSSTCSQPDWSSGTGEYCHTTKWIYSGALWRDLC